MNKFLENTIYFSIPLIVVFSLFVILMISSKNEQENFTLDNRVHSLIIGDSHIQSGINDSLLFNTQNIGKGSEVYIYSYHKIVKLKQYNPNINTLFLGFSPHNLSDYSEEAMYNTSVSSPYFWLLPLAIQYQILMNTKMKFSLIYKIIASEFYRRTGKLKKEVWLGRYANFATEKKISRQSIEKRIEELYFIDGRKRDFSKTQLLFLHKIVTFCKKENIVLIFLNVPLHQIHKEKIPKKFNDKYEELIDTYQIALIDFRDLELDDNCFLPDGDHLSAKGANMTTNYLKNFNVESLVN